MYLIALGAVALALVLYVFRMAKPKKELGLPVYGPHVPVKPITASSDVKTMGQLFATRAQRKPAAPAYYEKIKAQWTVTTWGQFYECASKIANYFVNEEKLPVGTAVCILGPTKPKWGILDMAIQLCGCISVGIYPHQSADQYKYILEHCEAPVLFVEGAEELKTVLEAVKDLPKLRTIITWDDATATKFAEQDKRIKPWGVVDKHVLDEDTVKKRSELQSPGQIATIVYTSGTTGPPKGVMISHRNILHLLGQSARHLYLFEDDITLSFLPMAHVAEKIAGFYGRLDQGYTCAFATSIPQVLPELQEIRPTIFGSVPRIFEKAYGKIFAELDKKPPIVHILFSWASAVGVQRTRLHLAGKPVPVLLEAKYKLAYKLFAPVRNAFGGRVRMMVVGAAPIDLKILEFFWAAGVCIYEVYGMTELTCISHQNTPHALRLQTVGKVGPGLQCKIADDGEILIKGPTVFEGYFKNKEATQETIGADGWLHTGDIGQEDADGFLKITDRKKHLIITAGGKNLSPANIENSIKNKDFLISQVHAHGDKRPFVSAIIAPSPIETLEFGVSKGLVLPTTKKQLETELMTNPVLRSESLNQETAKVVTHPDYIARIRAAVVKGNEDLSQVEKVKKFVILDRDFSQEHGELTPSMKMKRREIEKKYETLFEKIYSNPKFAVNVYDGPVGGE